MSVAASARASSNRSGRRPAVAGRRSARSIRPSARSCRRKRRAASLACAFATRRCGAGRPRAAAVLRRAVRSSTESAATVSTGATSAADSPGSADAAATGTYQRTGIAASGASQSSPCADAIASSQPSGARISTSWSQAALASAASAGCCGWMSAASAAMRVPAAAATRATAPAMSAPRGPSVGTICMPATGVARNQWASAVSAGVGGRLRRAGGRCRQQAQRRRQQRPPGIAEQRLRDGCRHLQRRRPVAGVTPRRCEQQAAAVERMRRIGAADDGVRIVPEPLRQRERRVAVAGVVHRTRRDRVERGVGTRSERAGEEKAGRVVEPERVDGALPARRRGYRGRRRRGVHDPLAEPARGHVGGEERGLRLVEAQQVERVLGRIGGRLGRAGVAASQVAAPGDLAPQAQRHLGQPARDLRVGRPQAGVEEHRVLHAQSQERIGESAACWPLTRTTTA